MAMGRQATLFDFHDPTEFEPDEFTKTIILRLADPTRRKRDRLERAIERAHMVTTEASHRFPSVPPERWGTAHATNSTWYNWAKELDHGLGNHTASENIQRVREAFRRWQSGGYTGSKPRFDRADRCSFHNEQPQFPVHNGRYYLSLPLAAGRGERELLPLRTGRYSREWVDAIRSGTISPEFAGAITQGSISTGRGELLRRDRHYEFHQAINGTVSLIANPTTAIGVDVGLTNVAVTGAITEEGKTGAELWSGSEMANMRDRFYDRKRNAQSEGEYEQIRDQDARYVEHECNRISREVVEWAMRFDRPMIVLEDLTGIRDTFIQRKREHTSDERRALHSWPFRKLQEMIDYKAREAGIPVREIDPRNTSKRCNECGHVADDNRNGIHFACVNCEYRVNADVNGAFNIAGTPG